MREGLEAHNNDYGFNPNNTAGLEIDSSLSVIILYYDTGELFDTSMHHLNNAIRQTDADVEVVVVDDGSKSIPPSTSALGRLKDCDVKVKTHEANKGRTAARNTGLSHATGDTVVYMDSDIVPDVDQLQNHALLHAKARQFGRNAVVTSLFDWRENNDVPIPALVEPGDMAVNDWRVTCNYQPTWIGCEADKVFVGQSFKILEKTDNLRTWQQASTRGQYGPWVLPNMVIGGLFSANRQDLEVVNGFDPRFTSYGFDETTGVTKLLVARDNVVIPCLRGGAVNLPNPGVELNRAEKDASFREMHQRYFGTYLAESNPLPGS